MLGYGVGVGEGCCGIVGENVCWRVRGLITLRLIVRSIYSTMLRDTVHVRDRKKMTQNA